MIVLALDPWDRCAMLQQLLAGVSSLRQAVNVLVYACDADEALRESFARWQVLFSESPWVDLQLESCSCAVLEEVLLDCPYQTRHVAWV